MSGEIFEARVVSEAEEKNGFVEFTVKTGKRPEQIRRQPGGLLVLARCYSQIPEINRGDTIRLTGNVIEPRAPKNPGQFNYRAYLARKNIFWIIYPRKIEVVKKSRFSFFDKLISGLRGKMKKSVNLFMPAEEASVLNGIFIGEKSGIPAPVKDAFINAGVMHLLVASGLNVGYVAAIFWFILRFLPLPNFWRRVLLVPPIIVYCFIAGANPPIVRATVMAIAVILCYILERESLIYHSLALAALVIMFFDPRAIFGASFQLSFAACLGIVYLYPKLTALTDSVIASEGVVASPPWRTKNPRQRVILSKAKDLIFSFIRPLALLFFISLSAQIAVAPLLAYYFHKLSIIALAANLICVPLSGIMLWLCFIQFFVYVIIPPPVAVAAVPLTSLLCHWSAWLMLTLVNFFAGFPGAVWHTGQPNVILIVLLYLFGIAFVELRKISLRFGIAGLTVALYLVFYVLLPKPLTLIFFDVGLGDATFIETPSGERVFIDCGGDNMAVGERIFLPYLRFKGINSIDKIFITHSHWVHYAGLKTLIENVRVKQIIINDWRGADDELKEVLKEAFYRGTLITVARAGQRYNCGKAAFDILGPRKIERITPEQLKYWRLPLNIYDRVEDANSLAIKLTCNGLAKQGKFTALFAGDTPRELFGSIARATGSVNLLLAPAHGNHDPAPSTMRALNPEKVIYSTNRKVQSKYSTQNCGAIQILIKKNTCAIKTN